MRNKLVILSKKLLLICFFGMFVYAICSKIFNLDIKYVIFPFIGNFFLFGFMTLPIKENIKHFSSWILPIGFMSATIGLSLMFIPIMFFNETLKSNFATTGAFFFMFSILILFSTLLINRDGYRSVSDTDEIESAFKGACEELELTVQKQETRTYLTYCGNKNLHIGQLELKVGAPKRARAARDAAFSSLVLSNVQNTLLNVQIENFNDALEITNISKELKNSIETFVKTKQLNLFNFRLSTTSNAVSLDVDVALEEKDLWIDFLELMKKVNV